ncbi:hypothetical protein LXL04_020669 [Taraxacum kok-saghyz]
MNKKGAIGSPCLTPLLNSNSYVAFPLTRTEARPDERHPLTHPLHFSLKFICSKTESKKPQFKESKALSKSTLNTSAFRFSLLAHEFEGKTIRSRHFVITTTPDRILHFLKSELHVNRNPICNTVIFLPNFFVKGNVIFNGNRSGRLFIKSFLKTYLKSLCYFSFKIYFIYLSESCHVFQYGIIARGLPTHKVSHLTKPTSKTTCTKRNGPKAIQEQVLVNVSRINLTRVPNPFATREPGQPSVQMWGMTTTSHTDPDASISLLRCIGDTSITRVAITTPVRAPGGARTMCRNGQLENQTTNLGLIARISRGSLTLYPCVLANTKLPEYPLSIKHQACSYNTSIPTHIPRQGHGKPAVIDGWWSVAAFRGGRMVVAGGGKPHIPRNQNHTSPASKTCSNYKIGIGNGNRLPAEGSSGEEQSRTPADSRQPSLPGLSPVATPEINLPAPGNGHRGIDLTERRARTYRKSDRRWLQRPRAVTVAAPVTAVPTSAVSSFRRLRLGVSRSPSVLYNILVLNYPIRCIIFIGNVIFNGNRSGRLFIKSFLKTYLKSLCYFSFKIYFIYLSESCHVFQYGIIARGLPTHKVSHLTKPTSKTTCTKRNGPKAIQEQVLVNVSRINLTRVPNPFATREPGQPSVQMWGMTTTSHTDPDASLSLLRRIGDTSITRVAITTPVRAPGGARTMCRNGQLENQTTNLGLIARISRGSLTLYPCVLANTKLPEYPLSIKHQACSYNTSIPTHIPRQGHGKPAVIDGWWSVAAFRGGRMVVAGGGKPHIPRNQNHTSPASKTCSNYKIGIGNGNKLPVEGSSGEEQSRTPADSRQPSLPGLSPVATPEINLPAPGNGHRGIDLTERRARTYRKSDRRWLQRPRAVTVAAPVTAVPTSAVSSFRRLRLGVSRSPSVCLPPLCLAMAFNGGLLKLSLELAKIVVDELWSNRMRFITLVSEKTPHLVFNGHRIRAPHPINN